MNNICVYNSTRRYILLRRTAFMDVLRINAVIRMCLHGNNGETNTMRSAFCSDLKCLAELVCFFCHYLQKSLRKHRLIEWLPVLYNKWNTRYKHCTKAMHEYEQWLKIKDPFRLNNNDQEQQHVNCSIPEQYLKSPTRQENNYTAWQTFEKSWYLTLPWRIHPQKRLRGKRWHALEVFCGGSCHGTLSMHLQNVCPDTEQHEGALFASSSLQAFWMDFRRMSMPSAIILT